MLTKIMSLLFVFPAKKYHITEIYKYRIDCLRTRDPNKVNTSSIQFTFRIEPLNIYFNVKIKAHLPKNFSPYPNLFFHSLQVMIYVNISL